MNYETVKAQKERAEKWVTRGAVLGIILAVGALAALVYFSHFMPMGNLP